MQCIDQFDIRERRVFIRVDFNVTLRQNGDEWEIIDDTRIRETLKTLKYAQEQKAKIILASHLGRPKGKVDSKFSLLPVAQRLSQLLETEVFFPENCIGDAPRKIIREMAPGQVVLLENLRFHSEEEANDRDFAQKLAGFCDVFINDAFGTMHRAHASTAMLPSLIKERGIGFLVQKELRYLGQMMERPEHPFTAIIGGNKISDKIGVIRQLIHKVDTLLIVGGMAYTFMKEQGLDIGKSVVEKDRLDLVKDLHALAKEKNTRILLPLDHVIASAFQADAPSQVVLPTGIHGEWMGLDIGPKTVAVFSQEIMNSKTVFWNGPAGVYEFEKFRQGTLGLARAMAETQAVTVIGGGDSVAAIHELNLQDKIDHVSTGGGATLEFLSGKSLPGLASLRT